MPPVVVVVANRLLLDDLNNPALPNIARMMREGGVGFVCPNCAGPKTEASVMMTAGAGVGCKGGGYSSEFYAVDEIAPDGTRAGDSYKVRTGFDAKPGTLVFLGLGQALRDDSESSHTEAVIGACGDALKSAGLVTCFIGNADRPGKIDRSAAAILMDEKGQVSKGLPTVGYPNQDKPESLFSDVKAISRAVESNLAGSDVILVSFGDTVRLDEAGSEIDANAAKRYKTAAMANLDNLVGQLMAGAKEHSARLMLVSFSPPKEGTWNKPTPIVMWPAQNPGLLTSASTRTPGFIAAGDFAPTILKMFGVKVPGEIVGRPMETVATGGNKLAALKSDGIRVTANELMLAPVLLTVAFAGALAFTLISLATAFKWKLSEKIAKRLRLFLLLSGSWPLALLLAVYAPAGVVGYVTGTAVLAAASVAISLFIGRILSKIGWRFGYLMAVYAMTSAAVIADAFNGCQLGKFALLGAYQITAMRFYGIGNEYAGLIISMAACLCIFAPQRLRLKMVLAVGALLLVTFGIGAFGANNGGTLTSAVTFGLLWLSVRNGKFGARQVALTLVAAIALVYAFAVVDFRLCGSGASHSGRAIGLLENIGVPFVVGVVIRNIMVNLKHFGSKEALWVVLSFVPFLALWFWGVQDKVMSQFKADRQVIAGFKAVMIGAAVGLIFNDSGLVMGSMMVGMLFLALVYSLLKSWEGKCQE